MNLATPGGVARTLNLLSAAAHNGSPQRVRFGRRAPSPLTAAYPQIAAVPGHPRYRAMARARLARKAPSRRTAARRRGFIAGSGMPSLADTVISRASLPNSLDFTLSCRPLRCMMFLNWECPAMASTLARPGPPRAQDASGEPVEI